MFCGSKPQFNWFNLKRLVILQFSFEIGIGPPSKFIFGQITRTTTSISSEALSNYIKDIWKIKVENQQQKNYEKFHLILKLFTFLLFVAWPTDRLTKAFFVEYMFIYKKRLDFYPNTIALDGQTDIRTDRRTDGQTDMSNYRVASLLQNIERTSYNQSVLFSEIQLWFLEKFGKAWP